MRRLRPLLLAILIALVAAAPARAASAPMWSGVAERIADAMRALQQPDGTLEDYLSTDAQPYAEAMVGYGLLLHGLRTGEDGAVDAGLRALGATVRGDVRGGPRLDSVFKQLAVAAGYRLAVARLAGDPVFAAARPAWEAWLRQVRPVHLVEADGAAGNKHLVEAVADLELLGSGLTGGAPGSVLADPAGTRLRVLALVDERWPAMVRAQSRRGPDGRMAVTSDPPTHPLAYHALSLAMLDRAIDLLGSGATPTAHAALVRMARASAALAGPDGDLTYWGRSQEQSWALAMTAAGAGALRADGIDGAARAQRMRARAAYRLGTVHGFGPYGVWIVPALRTDAAAGRAAMDDYAANGVYNGLTLVGSEWTLADLADGDGRAAAAGVETLAADRDGAWVVDRGRASFAVSRHRSTWFAVRMRGGSGDQSHDPRYAFGLVAAKHRTAAGWRDVVPAAPRALGDADTPGPRLVLPDGRVAEAFGTRIRAWRTGVVVVSGGFRTATGDVVRRGVRFAFAPTPGGVTVSFGMRTGDVVEVADFRPASATPAGVDVSVWPRHERPLAALGAPLLRAGFASAMSGPVVRVSARVTVLRRGTVAWTPRGG